MLDVNDVLGLVCEKFEQEGELGIHLVVACSDSARTMASFVPATQPTTAERVQVMRMIGDAMATESQDVQRFILASEVWLVAAKSDEPLPTDLSTHPDRKEMLVAASMDRDGTVAYAQIEICRLDDGTPQLVPFELSDADTMESSLLDALWQGYHAHIVLQTAPSREHPELN